MRADSPEPKRAFRIVVAGCEIRDESLGVFESDATGFAGDHACYAFVVRSLAGQIQSLCGRVLVSECLTIAICRHFLDW